MGMTPKVLLHPHYMTSILLAISFYVARVTPGICEGLFSKADHPCNIEWREYEILCFLGIVIVFKNKRAPSWLGYVTTSIQFTKVANLVLFFRQEPQYGIIYGVLCLFHFILSTEPSFEGSELITHFTESTLQCEIEKSRHTIWFVCFTTPWSVMCQHFTPVYSQLATKYSLSNLRFGKIDANRYQDVASKYKVDPSATSKMLPTIIMFKWGKEARRRPFIDYKGRIQRYVFSEENIVADFDLANVYEECKKSSSSRPSPPSPPSPPGDTGGRLQRPGEMEQGVGEEEELVEMAHTRLANKHLMDRISKYDR